MKGSSRRSERGLFDSQNEEIGKISAPLADRMRPTSPLEFLGQEHLLGTGKPLRNAIEKDQLSSMIFWGPPGSGKTTLARIIASATNSHFIGFSAVLSGVKEIKEVIKEAEGQRFSIIEGPFFSSMKSIDSIRPSRMHSSRTWKVAF